MVGQTYSTDAFSITLDSAKIATTKVKGVMGDIRTGTNPDLTFAFTFKNNDDRRILRFREGNQFLGGHFKLRDDVDNVIRGIDYGLMSKPVGTLTGSEDIAPGSSVTHIEPFSIPPPKTEHLILTVDLACLGGDGVIEFKIPAASVAKYSEGFKIDSNSSIESSTLGAIISNPEPEPEPGPQLMVGQTYSTDAFSITLDSSKIATTKVKDMMGDIRTGKNPDLTFAFTFKNNDDRRILRFREGNQFLGGHFKLRDDVDNVIRGIDYGLMSKPVGTLTGSEDIAPGSSVTHIELFSIPPPKTEHLILTVDLACLGGDGVIEFKIPAASLAK